MRTFTTVEEAFSFIESFTNFEKLPPSSVRDYKLHRMEYLLKKTGSPHNAFRSYHIAGSKGKGSTAAFLSSILSQTGETAGLYTSPHVSSYKERITRGGRQFGDREYIKTINYLTKMIDDLPSEGIAGDWEPTTFELLTLTAFCMFRDAGLSWAVIETGIGGRLDATNIISPETSLITPIEMEHKDILGDSIESITGEKAGIIKPGIPVFVGYQEHGEAEKILKHTAQKLNSPVYFLKEEITGLSAESGKRGTQISLRWKDGFTVQSTIRLLGDFQGENAALAAVCARHSLEKKGYSAQDMQRIIRAGLEDTNIPGRMEICREDPPIILDGAHTPASIKRLTASFTSAFPGERILIFGSVYGKDYRSMAEIIAPAFTKIIISRPGTFKKSDPRSVFNEFRRLNPSAELIPEPDAAVKKALYQSRGKVPILITGSFYMIGEIRKLLCSAVIDNTLPNRYF